MIRTVITTPACFTKANRTAEISEKYNMVVENAKPILTYHRALGIFTAAISLCSAVSMVRSQSKDSADICFKVAALSGSVSLFNWYKTFRHENGLTEAKKKIQHYCINAPIYYPSFALNEAHEAYKKGLGFSLGRILFDVKYENKE